MINRYVFPPENTSNWEIWQNQVDDLKTKVGLRNVIIVGGPTGGGTKRNSWVFPSFLPTGFKGIGHDVSLMVDADSTSAKAIAPQNLRSK